MEYTDRILEYFKEITGIPRESGNEERMREYLIRFAHTRGLECRTDSVGNVCIVKEAAPGKENVRDTRTWSARKPPDPPTTS